MPWSKRKPSIQSVSLIEDQRLVEHGIFLSPFLQDQAIRVTNINRVYTPHLPPKLPSLRAIIEGNADNPASIPSVFPTETPYSEAVNSHQHRFSDSPQHENLHSNIDPTIMSYSKYPFPTTTTPSLLKKYGPDAPFRDREVIREWVENIFTRNGYEKLVSLATTVERAEKVDEKWILTLRKEEGGKNHWWQERFDAIVVASGHYNVPWIPRIPGILEFDGRFPGVVGHSKHFRDAEKFKGKVC